MKIHRTTFLNSYTNTRENKSELEAKEPRIKTKSIDINAPPLC